MNTNTRPMRRPALLSVALLAIVLVAGCERPPVDSVQRGMRGTAMVQVYNPRILDTQIERNTPPAEIPPIPSEPDGPKAADVYQNVKVVGHLGVGEFTRLMLAMTAWVSPEAGCTYCHSDDGNFASDDKYTKVVARRMLEMTQTINADWKSHVANTGVTCYTCHRGQPVPAQVWFKPLVDPQANRMAGSRAEQNAPAPAVGLTSLPQDSFTPFLVDAREIRVAGTTALPTGNLQSTKQTEYTYGLMMHMSSSLGVNCTYCHNSRAFGEWTESTPQRGTAWHGIRMVRGINLDYLEPLTDVFPANRLGPQGDVAKVNCATCHQGAYKPLFGAKLTEGHPELTTPMRAAMAAAAEQAATVTPTEAPAAQ